MPTLVIQEARGITVLQHTLQRSTSD